MKNLTDGTEQGHSACDCPPEDGRQGMSRSAARCLRRLICVLALTVVPGLGPAAAKGRNICGEIKEAYQSGSYRKHSIPSEQPTPDHLVYKLDVNKDGRLDQLDAYCGNGADASCEMMLRVAGQPPYEFSVPAGIRVVRFRGGIYIVNGLVIDASGHLSADNYVVHQLLPGTINAVCDKF